MVPVNGHPPTMKNVCSWVLITLLSVEVSCLSPLRRVTSIDTFTSGLASMIRMPVAAGSSTTVAASVLLQNKPNRSSPAPAPNSLRLFEFEGCPYCRKVREAITALDLVVDIVPCGRGSANRAEAVRIGGKEQFPLLVDARDSRAAPVVLYESADIISYLATNVAGLDQEAASAAVLERGGVLSSPLLSGILATAVRLGRGGAVGAAAFTSSPEAKRFPELELWSYEGNQFCRLVRETLTELDLPYRLVSCGKGSLRREDLRALSGGTSCPFLVDKTAGVALGESAMIVDHLIGTYAAADVAAPPPPPAVEAAEALASPFPTRAASSQAPDFVQFAGFPGFSGFAALLKQAAGLGGGGLGGGGAGPAERQRRALKAELAALCGGARYGCTPLPAAERARLEEVIDALAALNPTPRPAFSDTFNGEWTLLWTTEKELLFAVEKGLFGAGPCEAVTQTIDLPTESLTNLVRFGADSCLEVRSSVRPDAGDPSGARFDFAFRGCRLRWRGFDLPLPPVGKGWGALRYLDPALRIQVDSRGDTLITVK